MGFNSGFKGLNSKYLVTNMLLKSSHWSFWGPLKSKRRDA